MALHTHTHTHTQSRLIYIAAEITCHVQLPFYSHFKNESHGMNISKSSATTDHGLLISSKNCDRHQDS